MLRNKLLNSLSNDLVIILLLQSTNNNNSNNTLNPTHPNRISTSMNSILISNRPTIGTSNSVLLNKSSLDLIRRCPSHQSTNRLLSHRPTRHSPAEDGVSLPPHPVLIIWDSAAVRCTLEDDVQWDSAGCRGGERN